MICLRFRKGRPATIPGRAELGQGESQMKIVRPADRCIFSIMVCMLVALLPQAVMGSNDYSELCEDAALRASKQSGVPEAVLRAIALLETGILSEGSRRPWPWAVNVAGQGRWFATRGEAEQFALDTLRAGQQGFDVGCFQISYRWHGQAFNTVSAMFDPEANALYAANFLRTLHAKTGDWSLAAGAYHSATRERAEVYQARFDSAYADLAGGDRFAALTSDNLFPLLQAGHTGSAGSIVPITPDKAQPLIGY